MKKLLYLTFIFTMFFSCKSQDIVLLNQSCHNKVAILNFIRSEIGREQRRGNFIGKQILNRNSNGEPLEVLFKAEAFHLVRKLKLETEDDVIDFTKFFKENDFEYFKCQLKKSKLQNWDEILIDESFRKSDSIFKYLKQFKSQNDILKQTNYKKNIELNNRILFYSIPFFSTNGKYALIYRETVSSGSLYILKKVNDNWEYYATGLVWIE